MTLSNSLDQINAFDNLNIISDSTTTIITASILPKGHLFEDFVMVTHRLNKDL